MKITVSEEFDSVEDAAEYISLLAARTDRPQGVDAGKVVEVKKFRKSRSDAGQPRGPYKTNGGPAASNPGISEGGSSAPSPEAPVSPTNAAAPQAGNGASSVSASATTDGAGGGTSSPASAAAPTKEQAHNTLKLMGATKGLGTPACIEFLKLFGVQRFSDLKAEMYPLFVEQALAKIAEFTPNE